MTVLPLSSFFFFYCSLVAFHVCIEVQTVPVCAEFWCVLKKARNVPQSQKCVWEWGWSQGSGAALCSWGSKDNTELCTCFWGWWSSNWCPLLTVISSATGWWITTDNTPSAVKAGHYQVQKDLGLRLFQDVLNVSRGGVCLYKQIIHANEFILPGIFQVNH